MPVPILDRWKLGAEFQRRGGEVVCVWEWGSV